MAGSMKLVVYTSDHVSTGGGAGGGGTQKYLAKRDESNSTALGFDDANTPADLALPMYPGEWDMRTVTAIHIPSGAGAKPVKRTLEVGKPDHPAYASGGDLTMELYPGSGDVTWKIQGAQGEKRIFPKAEDTGLDDGSAT